MADITVPGITDYGQLLSSYPNAVANQNAQNAYAQHTQSEIPLVQQQTIGAALQNEMTRFGISQAMKYANMPASADNTGEQNPTNLDEIGIANNLNHRFFVDPMGPQGLQAAINGTSFMPNAGPRIQAMEQMRDKLVQQQSMRNAVAANTLYEGAVAAGQSADPLTSLGQIQDPQAQAYYKQIKAQYGNDPAKAQDVARNVAQDLEKYAWQYANRGEPKEDSGGNFRDPKNGRIVGEVPKSGLTSAKIAEIRTEADKLDEITVNNNKTWAKHWQASGFPSRDAYVLSKINDLTGNTTPSAAQPSPQNTPQGRAKIAAQVQAQQQPNNVVPGQTASGAQSTQGPSGVAGAQASQSPGGGAASQTPAGGPGSPTGLNSQQVDFIKNLPNETPKPPGSQQINENTQNQLTLERTQKAKLAATAGIELQRANVELQNVDRLNRLIDKVQYTGPGSEGRAQLDTLLAQYLGNAPAEVRAAAYQIAAKTLNANQMNGILQQFHAEGAQVRLGAYESRLIMAALAANLNMAKPAIKQLLQWGASDATYNRDKYQALNAASQPNSGKNVQNAEADYEGKFSRSQMTITGVGALIPFKNVKGKTYTMQEVTDNAKAAGYPDNVFRKELEANGAVIK